MPNRCACKNKNTNKYKINTKLQPSPCKNVSFPKSKGKRIEDGENRKKSFEDQPNNKANLVHSPTIFVARRMEEKWGNLFSVLMMSRKENDGEEKLARHR